MSLQNDIAFTIRRKGIQLSLYRLGKLLSGDIHTVSILCYHSIEKDGDRYSVPYEEFQRQMDAIRAVADIVPLPEGLEALTTGRRRRSEVVITIDDGYEDIMQIAEYTEKEKIPITLFAISDPDHADTSTLGNAKKLLQFSDIRYLAKKGWTIGCHSATHANLAKATQAELTQEVIHAKEVLEEKIGVSVDYFAYPNGVFSNHVIQAVKKAGYKAACSVLPGVLTPQTNKWLLPRTIVNTEDTIAKDPHLYIQGPRLVGSMIDRFGPWTR